MEQEEVNGGGEGFLQAFTQSVKISETRELAIDNEIEVAKRVGGAASDRAKDESEGNVFIEQNLDEALKGQGGRGHGLEESLT